MTGRRREGISPNLFPFLAVLVCTLGTLILLLALVSQNDGKATAAATQPAIPSAAEETVAEMAEASEELDRRMSEAKWYREQIVAMRDQQTAELEERRTLQAHLEDHVRRLREDLKRLEAEVAIALASKDDKTEAADSIESIKAKIHEEETKISKLQSEQATSTPRIVIVPHKGPNGTDRRPVYVECRASGVYLQPENIAIDPKYLVEPSSVANPLAAALRTIRLHALQNYGDTVAPYPLIIVRPGGIETYAAVRGAMKDWDDQFGYELVPDDVKLAFPETDPVLKDRVQVAINDAMVRQEAIARADSSSGGNAGGNGVDGRIRRGANGTTRRSVTALVSGDGGPYGVNDEITGNGVQSRGDVRLGDGLGPSEDLALGGGGTMGNDEQEPERYSAGGAPSVAPGKRTSKPASELPVLSAAKMDDGSLQPTEFGYPRPVSDGVQRQPSTSERLAKDRAAASHAANAREASSRDVQYGSAARDTDSLTSADSNAPLSDFASNSKVPSATTDPNAPIGGSQSMGTTQELDPAATAPPPLDNPMAQNLDPSRSPPPSSVTPSVNIDANRKKTRTLVKRAGANWALPPEVAASRGTAMVRTIRIECHPDQLILLPEGGRGATNVYGFSDGEIDNASLELATAIRDRVSRWGAGMPGGRWHPLLEVKVVPGGEVRYQQLRRLMDGSGVEIQTKGNSK